MERESRLHEPATSPTPAYSNRTPSPRRQSLYDWAPAQNDSDPQDNELDAILRELRRQQPDTHPDILRVLSQSQLDGARVPRDSNGTPAPGTTAAEALERRERLRERERRRRETESVDLWASAAIQRSRQEGSPRATERMLRYVMERERSGMSEEEERARGSGWFRPSPSRHSHAERRGASGWTMPPHGSEARDRERPERLEAFRRGYLAESVPSRLPRVSTPTLPTSSAPPSALHGFLENALKYLSDLRSIPSSEGMDDEQRRDRESQVLGLSMDHGLATKELWADKHDDFVMDLQSIEPLADSSWLQPGTVFNGYQHATNACLAPTSQTRSSNVTHVLEQINPHYGSHAMSTNTTGFDHPPGSTRVAPFDATRPWLSHQPTLPNIYSLPGFSKLLPPNAIHDQWPVRVTIHSVNTADMTLQGTMEAYDVPQHTLSNLNSLHPSSPDRPKAGRKNAPITTYLEGHIIDLTTHSFLTPSPPETARKSSGRPPHPHRAFPTSPPPAPALAPLSTPIPFPSATPAIDAANWLKLPPFSALPASNPEALARLLLSRHRLAKLNKEYIFMRWKERCFLPSSSTHKRGEGVGTATTAADNVPCPPDMDVETERGGTGRGYADRDRERGHGLTISGFYYVSLRRSTGEVEGLYFDPGSTPFQCLRLSGVGRGWPSIGVR
ncbi:hypothetical protein LTR91_001316 [Friedmanniomyces endolithicus]|uniref:Vacuolar import and degradation protein-domain-containing protein n=1 Tax=Friedmanniomyces endolithicus TaxID=329885 RepID=A0AAN6FME1_9PEZI|nr:hypothetical protein LTR35_012614 [Friedmanniomyces endolithicus]KAK0283862.1 hypothetical protein LTS00_011525 [Friedmanniomyces endolithicus]KAK0320426.1 hypothetical protein LTR82_008541 [Friedmanniomyces endolithicus]KAK0929801.1 hypothetical protein LTR57_001658 [Friedmanniomyces endolithicus]KAK0990410.1 hypothetical protein LTR54_012163 [Friedmanniomyces endolithicus]